MKIFPFLASTLVLAGFLAPMAQAQNGHQRQLFDDNWRFALNTNSSSLTADGMPVTQWVWIADDNAPNDASNMADPNLNVSTWTNVAIGTDVFNGRVGYAWFRATITNLASLVRPLSFYFESVDDNATVYLNGQLLGQNAGRSEEHT